MSANTYCSAELNYSLGLAESGPAVDEVTTKILDARSLVADDSWRNRGFNLYPHESQISDYDVPGAAKSYCIEMEDFAKEISGCDYAVSTMPVIRSKATAAKQKDFAPIQLVHTDYSKNYRAMIQDETHPYTKTLLPAMDRRDVNCDNLAEASRIVVLHFWRNIGTLKADYPLAVCDGQTMASSDLSIVPIVGYGGSDTVFETTICKKTDDTKNNRWYCYPQMKRDEVLMFRSFDSEMLAQGEHYWTPHTAFKDNSHGEQSEVRESIEMRVMCVYK